MKGEEIAWTYAASCCKIAIALISWHGESERRERPAPGSLQGPTRSVRTPITVLLLQRKIKPGTVSRPRPRVFFPSIYCTESASTPSPACTSSIAKTTMPVAVVLVTPMITISPTARRGKSRT